MSESTNQEPATDVSEEYLAAGRLSIRTKSTAFDGESVDLIRAARKDLENGGLLPERAVMTYIKAEFGLDNEDADQYRAAYQRLKVSLAMSSDYAGGVEV